MIVYNGTNTVLKCELGNCSDRDIKITTSKEPVSIEITMPQLEQMIDNIPFSVSYPKSGGREKNPARPEYKEFPPCDLCDTSILYSLPIGKKLMEHLHYRIFAATGSDKKTLDSVRIAPPPNITNETYKDYFGYWIYQVLESLVTTPKFFTSKGICGNPARNCKTLYITVTTVKLKISVEVEAYYFASDCRKRSKNFSISSEVPLSKKTKKFAIKTEFVTDATPCDPKRPKKKLKVTIQKKDKRGKVLEGQYIEVGEVNLDCPCFEISGWCGIPTSQTPLPSPYNDGTTFPTPGTPIDISNAKTLRDLTFVAGSFGDEVREYVNELKNEAQLQINDSLTKLTKSIQEALPQILAEIRQESESEGCKGVGITIKGIKADFIPERGFTLPK